MVGGSSLRGVTRELWKWLIEHVICRGKRDGHSVRMLFNIQEQKNFSKPSMEKQEAKGSHSKKKKKSENPLLSSLTCIHTQNQLTKKVNGSSGGRILQQLSKYNIFCLFPKRLRPLLGDGTLEKGEPWISKNFRHRG